MAQQYSPLLPFLAKIERHGKLSAPARAALLALPHSVRAYEPGSYLYREGDEVGTCWIIAAGFACRHKIVANGSRQILAIYMKGDGIDLEKTLMPFWDHSVQALTAVKAAAVPVAAVRAIVDSELELAHAIWLETLLDSSIQREWTANVGRRDARTRVAHVLCELGFRQEAAGLGPRDDYELPVTQEQLADATGLTAVHVNRVLGGLKSDGTIIGRHRRVQVPDWARLTTVGDFRTAYLDPGRGPRSA